MPAELQHTLVAFFGRKPAPLAKLLDRCQHALRALCPQGYHPYTSEQVHATLVGLEHPPGARSINRNFLLLHDEEKIMDISGYAKALLAWRGWPIPIRFGGFAPHESPFPSRGGSPYYSSFGIYGNIPVITGWPFQVQSEYQTEKFVYTQHIEDLRRLGQNFNILHKYHRLPGAADPSLYLRLGIFDPLRPGEIDRICSTIRSMLHSDGPFEIELDALDLAIVAYEENTLNPSTSRAVPLDRVDGKL